MMNEPKRKLAAVVAADVVGYSRLMGEDEAGTLMALRQWRSEVFDPAVTKYRGKIIKNMGDGWLVEFDSASNAAEFAITAQNQLANHDILKLRIGLHVGDITHADADIYGDGVNIAARLQDLADPGAIIISDITRRSIEGKIAENFSELGTQTLKNIKEPISVYGWGMAMIFSEPEELPSILKMPDGPSIAIMPFANRSNAETSWIADGIAEDISRSLIRNTSLRVVGRALTGNYKDKTINLVAAGNELNVQYVLTGAINVVGTRLRISAELSDAKIGEQTWAEIYEGDLATDDVFDLQDQISQCVLVAIGGGYGVISQERQKRVANRPVTSLSSYECITTVYDYLENISAEKHARARECLENTVKREPGSSEAWANLGLVISAERYMGFNPKPDILKRAQHAAGTAIRLEPNNPTAWRTMSLVRFYSHDVKGSLEAAELALRINPNDPETLGSLGYHLCIMGKYIIGLPLVDKAIKLMPIAPWWMRQAHLLAAQDQGDWAEVLELSKQIEPSWLWWGYARRAAAYAYLGEVESAKSELAKSLDLKPDISETFVMEMEYFNSPQSRTDAFLAGLRKAGLSG